MITAAEVDGAFRLNFGSPATTFDPLDSAEKNEMIHKNLNKAKDSRQRLYKTIVTHLGRFQNGQSSKYLYSANRYHCLR